MITLNCISSKRIGQNKLQNANCVRAPGFINPAFMYSLVWLCVLFLYYLRLSELLSPLSLNTVYLVAGTSLALIIGWILESFNHNFKLSLPRFNLELLKEYVLSPIVGRRLRFAGIAFLLGSITEVIYCGGIPGLGVLGIGPEILYTEFGIPVFHGILNSIFYSCCIVHFARALISNSQSKLLLFVSILNPYLGMSRQMLISLSIQYLLLYFCIRNPSFKSYVKSLVVILAIILIFGYAGDIRSGRDHIISLAAPVFEYPDWLPSAIIWVYIYISTPLNNLNYNIDVTPNYFPLETASTFIPSFAREYFLNLVGSKNNWDLAHEAFNVSSILQSLLVDFGVGGSVLIMLPVGLMFANVMRLANTRVQAFFALIIILHGLALSFFANLLFHLVFVFEIIIVFILFNGVSKK